MHLIISLFHFKSFLYLLTRKYTISCFLEIAHLSCACIFFCVGSHARLRCMCTCNRCTFCLCQNFLNSELVQTVRTKLYTVVFSRFSGWFYLASLLFLYFYISLLNSSLFIHFIYHPDSHSFSFISAFWFGLINFWLYRLYENANGAAAVTTFCGLISELGCRLLDGSPGIFGYYFNSVQFICVALFTKYSFKGAL